jgi:hypothetical protein
LRAGTGVAGREFEDVLLVAELQRIASRTNSSNSIALMS